MNHANEINSLHFENLKNYYYQPGIYYTNTKAAWKLKQHFGKEYTIPEIKWWLERQPIYQVYQPKPKTINYAHYTISEPNNTHQVDILYMPHDGKFKYALTVIDCASRYKAAFALKTKTSKEVAKAIEQIYETTPLNFPKVIMSDFGHEFTAEYLELMNKHNVKLSKSKEKKKVAFVERFNRTLAEKLFKVQYNKEIITNLRNTAWVDNLHSVVDKLNNTETRMIGMKPVDAIKLENVEQPQVDVPQDELLSLDSIVRYLYKPGEAEGDKRYRATDPIWSVDFYLIDEIITNDGGVIYKLQGLEDRVFTKEELMVIPNDTVGLEEYEIV